MEGGEVRWKDVEDKPILPLDDARAIFRDIVLGLEYRKSPSTQLYCCSAGTKKTADRVAKKPSTLLYLS
jgi:hypothetical protein